MSCRRSVCPRVRSQGFPWRWGHYATALAAALLHAAPSQAEPSPIEPLADLSLEELSNLEVTSVSKSAELLRRAPAAIYVITHDEIVRSGVTSIPEALRLAPNLQISQYTSSRYVAGARGFAGAEEAQNFSNKLLILIDGRSVYSPLFSGVYLDAQDVLLEDVDRIEVISGPGATLWGANAMHGVINIITRPAYFTEGVFAALGAGDHERSVRGRFGDKIDNGLAYRIYGQAFERESMLLADGGDANDDWYKGQAGFRTDWERGPDAWTVQADLYRAKQGQPTLPDLNVEGINALGRFQRHGEAGDLKVQAYYDYTNRAQPVDGAAFVLRTFDIEIQQSLALGSAHQLIMGAGARRHDYEITNGSALLFAPNARELTLANVFAQDTIAFADTLALTIGLKFERDSFSGWNPLPDVRLAWRLSDEASLWASASRAIRSPTPFDRDVIEQIGALVFLTGNPSFDPERVDAFEIGYRGQPHADVSISIAAFYNRYDRLRTIEPAPGGFLPLRWDNLMEGDTYGLEAWGKWQATSWWRLAPGVRLLRKRLEFSPGASALLDLGQAGNDPKAQALLTSSMDLGPRVRFDATLRYVDSLPDPALDSYYELNASLGFRFSPQLDLIVTGSNLLDSRHQEYPAPAGELIRRSVFAEARWRF